MNNMLSYCGLVDAKIRTSDKDSPVLVYLELYQILKKDAREVFTKLLGERVNFPDI